MSRSKILFGKKLALTVLVGALAALPAFADETSDVHALLSAGKLVEAKAKADTFLAQHPDDAQMRFLKGLILSDQHKTVEAIAVFEKLKADHPDRPELYNNLAVLYASFGQLDKARIALEGAVRQKPDYAIAYENLGDIYAKLANRSYDKVMQLAPDSANAKFKLSLIRAFAKATDGLKSMASTESVADVGQASHKMEQKAAANGKAMAGSDADYAAVLATVNSWVNAWSAQDMTSYLSLYSADFQTPRGESRAKWEKIRRARIENKERIDVKIETPKIVVRGNWAKVKFRQIYKSEHLSEKDRKTLVLEKVDGRWLIKKEYVNI